MKNRILVNFNGYLSATNLKIYFKPFLSYNHFKLNVDLFIKTWNFHHGSMLLFILVDQMFFYIENKCKNQKKKEIDDEGKCIKVIYNFRGVI